MSAGASYRRATLQTGPRWIDVPPELLQTPPNTEVPMHEDSITECGTSRIILQLLCARFDAMPIPVRPSRRSPMRSSRVLCSHDALPPARVVHSGRLLSPG